MFGDQHLTVKDPHQMLRGYRLDWFPGQHDRHPIPKPAQGDQAVLVHPALHPGQPHNRSGRLHHHRPLGRRWNWRGLTDGLYRGGGESEPLDRWPHPKCLVRPFGVVVHHPGIQRRLQLRDRGVLMIMLGEELRTYRFCANALPSRW